MWMDVDAGVDDAQGVYLPRCLHAVSHLAIIGRSPVTASQ